MAEVSFERDVNTGVSTATLTTGDTAKIEMPPGKAVLASVQAEGNFGSGTLTVKVSNDGTNFRALRLLDGTAAPTLTDDGYVEISTGARIVQFDLTGGSGGSIVLSVNGSL